MRSEFNLRKTARPMKSSKAMIIIRKVYDWVESALWAGLTGFVIYFSIYIVPNMSEIGRQVENVRIMKNAAENSSYCEKWGMKRQTHEHTLCTMDLQELRKKIEQEFADQVLLL